MSVDPVHRFQAPWAHRKVEKSETRSGGQNEDIQSTEESRSLVLYCLLTDAMVLALTCTLPSSTRITM